MQEEESPYRSRRKQKQLEHSRHTSASSWMPTGTFKVGAFFPTVHLEMLHMMEPHIALFVALTAVGNRYLALDLLEREYLDHFDYILILCPTLPHIEMYY